jgi:hypothetical protein
MATMPAAITFVVFALAVARVVRLVNEDVIFEHPRARLLIWLWTRNSLPAVRREYAGEGGPEEWRHAARLRGARLRREGATEPLPVYLVTCPWCASIYVAAVAAPLAYFWGSSPWLFVPALALAFSYVTGYLAQFGGS